MSIHLLDNVRRVSTVLRDSKTSRIVFDDLCETLSKQLQSNVLVLSRNGKILGAGYNPQTRELKELLGSGRGTFIEEQLNERLLLVLSTKENVSMETLGFDEGTDDYYGVINPIEVAGERLGTIFQYRKEMYRIDDIILSEYITTIIGLELLQAVNEEKSSDDRLRREVESTIASLSQTEIDVLNRVFTQLEGLEGILVTSKIADEAGVTRSVLVNALRKCESSGVIESHSSGMRGTYLKVVNEYLLEELSSHQGNRVVKRS
ncbi:MAG: GTP-sensing pleiotropic transcriptional regulator CodY [Lachnospiraceae bacterium]|nr:GTP-sensing pleiotropic transcriptional regulator CodY [Lachnospiraceae bacterium]MDY5741410.1 GTP-sensing pleiotropic transcriptional regulator CodY [Lachnospiraceae bacterium]